MPDNFDLYETTDDELAALMADMGLDEDGPQGPTWAEPDPWTLDEEFDAW